MTLMTIGDFSRATRLSAKALRAYHESGLLTPARVDPHNGYRLYAAEQLADARVISALRSLDAPLALVREVLATADVAERETLLRSHLRELEALLAATRSAVQSLRTLLDPAPAPLEVVHRSVPAQRAVGVHATIELDALGEWFRGGVGLLTGLVASGEVAASGPYGGAWSTELFLDGRGEAALYVPVDEAPGALPPEASVVRLSAVTLAVATSEGPDEEVARVYAALGEYVARRELGVPGPSRETYLEGFPGIDARTRTEVGWPVFPVSGSRS
ncbi:MerR family transcriptional regulator [Georgenia phoenicis]|uniref:MerR family transcriptional regulator n=1 Tax=unclassified Georgenia TaxID=2626815 RepID=UPI0039AF201A